MANNLHEQQNARISAYYTFQSKIYDWTRWSFLFGRRQILQVLPYHREDTFHLLEVGCGTGHNLSLAGKMFPEADLTGLDVSPDMLKIARKRLDQRHRVHLLHLPYQKEYYTWTGKLDVILFSYALTMINPQWEELIIQAQQDLRPGGHLAVVDFHDSRWPFFKNHMAKHHVRMDAHLLPVLQEHFTTVSESISPAYGGLWYYLTWLGRKQ
jgi:S-adenosylmethionine-diacylgycerolhomoserine-N-methlytransferase